MTEPTRQPRCERTPDKIKYLTRGDAEQGARRRVDPPSIFRRRQSWVRLATQPYLCTSCGYWHNATPFKSQREPKEKK